MINESPNIVSTISTRGGYLARALCLVDGFPAEVRIRVDTHHQDNSTFEIHVFNPISMDWDRLYALDYDDIGYLPVLGHDPATIIELNTVAQLLWRTANVVSIGARKRQDQLDVELHTRKQIAMDDVRQSESNAERWGERWTAPEISQGEFVVHGEVVDE